MFVHFFFFSLLFQLTVNCQVGPAVVQLVVEEAKTDSLQLKQNLGGRIVLANKRESAN